MRRRWLSTICAKVGNLTVLKVQLNLARTVPRRITRRAAGSAGGAITNASPPAPSSPRRREERVGGICSAA